MMQYRSDRIQTVVARRQSQLRFVTKLGRACFHVFTIDVRRVADNKLVLRVAQLVEETGMDEPHALPEVVQVDVYRSDLQRFPRDVDGVDLRRRKRVRDGDGNAATASPQIQGMAHAGAGEPGFETIRDELGEWRTRHEYALVDIEAVAGKPRLVQKVGQRPARSYALLRHPFDLLDSRWFDALRINAGGRRVVEREFRKHEPRGFVHRVVGTVPVVEMGRSEARCDTAYELLNGRFVHIRHGREWYTPVESRAMYSKNLIIGVALAIALVAGLLVFMLVETPRTPPASPPPLTATLYPAPVPLPDFELVDQAGAAAGRDVFEGHWDLVFFGFTSCPDICPITLSVLADAKTKLANAGHSPLPRIVLVSVDPERDTPERLADYIAYFGEDNLGLTGDIDEIRSFTKHVGVFFEKREADGDDYTVDHSAVVLLIDPDAELRGLFSSPHKAENFINDLKVITTES